MKKRKTEFGADLEADNILDSLPRGKTSFGPNAYVWIDASGRLRVHLESGLLVINERDLVYVHGDELYG